MSDHTKRLARRLSPRRKFCARCVLEYLAMWHSSRVFLDDRHYAHLRNRYNIGKAAVNRAIDDLHAIERVTVSLAGKLQFVTALTNDVEDVA